ncbi:type II toxin-antitoxin system PemK/MazF family toxin [Halonotius sp. F2-221B]|uniref:type II toxin-antitoxin system PemK/MazF family toxin n=1 Tax=Halonotius sp. F2-221B TaxID=2731620 RepID=UPI00398AE641
MVRRGDIVRVDLGGPDDDDTRGSELYKSRRAVVIQNDTGNEFAPTTIVAPLSKGHTDYPFHVNLSGSMPELEVDSHVQLDQIRTIDIEQRITDHFGRVTDSQLADIDDAIRVSLGLLER